MDLADSASSATPEKHEDALIEAMAHPLRGRVLAVLAGYQGDEGLTISEAAETLNQPLRRVRYQVDVLLGQGLVTVTRERQRRGVVERTFRADKEVLIPKEGWLKLAPAQARRITLEIIKSIFADVTAAFAARTFPRGAEHFEARLVGTVDRRSFEELLVLNTETFARMQSIVDAGEQRVSSEGGPPVSVVAALLFFPMPMSKP